MSILYELREALIEATESNTSGWGIARACDSSGIVKYRLVKNGNMQGLKGILYSDVSITPVLLYDIRVLSNCFDVYNKGSKLVVSSVFDSNLPLLDRVCPRYKGTDKWFNSEANKIIVDCGKSLYKILYKKYRCTKMLSHIYMNELGVLCLRSYNLSKDSSCSIIDDIPYDKDSKIAGQIKVLLGHLDSYKESVKEIYFIFDDPDEGGIADGRLVAKPNPDGELTISIY